MKSDTKRMGSLVVILLLILGLLYQAVYTPVVESGSGMVMSEENTQEKKSWEDAEKDLLFWYTDETMEEYFQTCAADYYEETGIAVDVESVDTVGYMETIYQNSIDDTSYPDVYMAKNDSLEKAYLYGVAAVNPSVAEYGQEYAGNALKAASYQGIMYGYPLKFNTPVFVYQTETFQEAPVSIQAVLDYSSENEMGNNVGSLLEWSLGEEFYNFAFVGDSMEFSEEEQGSLTVNCNQELFTEELTFMQSLAQVITIDADTITREQVLSDFNEGATATAIIDAEDLDKITIAHGVAVLPPLNDILEMRGIAETELLFVNQFSEQREEAEAFAAYVSLEAIDELETMTGYFPVKKMDTSDDAEKTAYEAYEKALNMPGSMNADDFWKELQQKVISVWSGGTI